MSILIKNAILEEVSFDPKLDIFQIQMHAVDLRIEKECILKPGEHIIAKSMEAVTLPNSVMAVVYPRSSLNRSLVSLDMTGIVDAGYSGKLVLPLTNHSQNPVHMYAGQRIASLVFHRLEEPIDVLKKSRYHDTDGELLPDKEEEASMLKSGDVAGLKRKYSL